MEVRFVFLFVLITFYSVSCRKNKDKTPPVITIDAPLRNTPVNAGSILHVKGTVTDESKLEYVTVKITSLDGSLQLIAPFSIVIENNSADFDSYVVVGDIHTTSGTYQVIVEAGDGVNIKKEYREIVVSEIPRVFQKTIIVKSTTTGFMLDSLVSGTFYPFLFRTTDFSSAAINNYHQQMYVAGNTNGIVECIGLKYLNTVWTASAEVPPSGIPLYYFNFFDANSRVYWQAMASATSGKLKSYTALGSISSVLTMQPLHCPSAMLVSNTHIVVAEKSLTTGGDNYLNYYYKTGYALDHATVAPLAIQKIFALPGDELVVIGNNGTQGELRIYNPLTNSFWEQVNIPLGKVYDAVQINDDELFIAHQSGILKFSHSSTSLVNVSSDRAQVLSYDVYSNTVYGGVGNSLKTYHTVTGSVMASLTASDSIKAILHHYNK